MRSININRALVVAENINSILSKNDIHITYFIKHTRKTNNYAVCFESKTEFSQVFESTNTHEILTYLYGVIDLLEYLTDNRRK